MRSSLVLSSSDVLAAVERLEGERLPIQTLASWAASGIVTPSVRWTQQRGRHHGRLYSLMDLALVRLVVRLRHHGVSMPKVRAMLAYIGPELRDVLRSKTNAALVVDGQRAYITQPGQADREIPSGQLRLKLGEVVRGNQTAAREAQRAA